MSEYVPDYVWAFVLALVITFALTPLVKRFAVAVGAIDKPDARKVHHGAIPRSWWIGYFPWLYRNLCYLIIVFLMTINYSAFVLGTVILDTLLVFWDDIRQIEPNDEN